MVVFVFKLKGPYSVPSSAFSSDKELGLIMVLNFTFVVAFCISAVRVFLILMHLAIGLFKYN